MLDTAGAVIFSLWPKETTTASASVQAVSNVGPGSVTTQGNTIHQLPSGGPARPNNLDFKSLFTKSGNYWAYAHQVLPAARAGNADAQFYLAFDRCHEFQDNDLTEFGNASDWLRQATAAGQPLARSMFGRDIWNL
jgi:hypothetical protein